MVFGHADAGIAPGGAFAPPRDMVHGQAKVERGDGAPLRISMSRLE
jgi:hypothetical protein